MPRSLIPDTSSFVQYMNIVINIFPSLWLAFLLFMMAFEEQEFLILMRFALSIFSFMPDASYALVKGIFTFLKNWAEIYSTYLTMSRHLIFSCSPARETLLLLFSDHQFRTHDEHLSLFSDLLPDFSGFIEYSF